MGAKNIHSLCPRCVKYIPSLNIDKDTLFINCECEYKGYIHLEEYRKEYNQKKRKCKFTNRCKSHKRYYLTFYCFLKNCHI